MRFRFTLVFYAVLRFLPIFKAVLRFSYPTHVPLRLHDTGWAELARFAEMTFSPVLNEASQPGRELNLASTVFAESCCFENGAKRRMF